MIDKNSLEKIDSQNMYEIYDKWPEIAENQIKENLIILEKQKCEHIVFAGMGGSGALGDLFSSILSKTSIHVDVVKGYVLPKTVNENSLVVTTSISGNTLETLAILESAKKIGCKIIAFSSGGKIEEFCKKNNIEFKKILMHHSPRASFTSFLFAMLKVLQPVLPIKNIEIMEAIETLKELKKKIDSDNLSKKNPALMLAENLSDTPVIYFPWGLQAAVIRFKNSLQENSKIHVISEDIIEACHNGIVSWSNESNFKPILIRGADDHIKTQERWEILKDFFKKEKIEYVEIFSVKGNIITKIINLIYLFDYASIYKAVLNKTDPSPVEAIDYVKRRL